MLRISLMPTAFVLLLNSAHVGKVQAEFTFSFWDTAFLKNDTIGWLRDVCFWSPKLTRIFGKLRSTADRWYADEGTGVTIWGGINQPTDVLTLAFVAGLWYKFFNKRSISPTCWQLVVVMVACVYTNSQWGLTRDSPVYVFKWHSRGFLQDERALKRWNNR